MCQIWRFEGSIVAELNSRFDSRLNVGVKKVIARNLGVGDDACGGCSRNFR